MANRERRRTGQGPQRGISLLFDLFVLNQRVKTLVSHVLRGAGMRADEYAVYSLLFEVGPLSPTEMSAQMAMPLTTVLDYLSEMRSRRHVRRGRHPRDGRSYQCSLTAAGLAAFHRASRAWNAGLADLEPSLSVPAAQVRRALNALDDATAKQLDRLSHAVKGGAG